MGTLDLEIGRSSSKPKLRCVFFLSFLLLKENIYNISLVLIYKNIFDISLLLIILYNAPPFSFVAITLDKESNLFIRFSPKKDRLKKQWLYGGRPVRW